MCGGGPVPVCVGSDWKSAGDVVRHIRAKRRSTPALAAPPLVAWLTVLVVAALAVCIAVLPLGVALGVDGGRAPRECTPAANNRQMSPVVGVEAALAAAEQRCLEHLAPAPPPAAEHAPDAETPRPAGSTSPLLAASTLANESTDAALQAREPQAGAIGDGVADGCDARRARTRAAEPARQAAVRAAFLHAWGGYVQYAWGDDELDALRRVAVASYGMGLTIVDSLDTLHLMNLTAEFDLAVEWVRTGLRFGEQEDVNLFEVTIRVLGGLLSAYELSHERTLLDAAEQLGTRLLIAFDSPTGLPYGTLGLKSKKKYNPGWCKGASTVAEVATLQLEFRALSRHTANPAFEAAAQRVMAHLRGMRRPASLPAGLYPTLISPETGEFASSDVTLGARADSVYEYFLKQWLLSGRTDEVVRRMYDESIDAVVRHLVRAHLTHVALDELNVHARPTARALASPTGRVLSARCHAGHRCAAAARRAAPTARTSPRGTT